MRRAKHKTKSSSGFSAHAPGRNRHNNSAPHDSLFDSALSVVQTDLAGRILDCNPRLAVMLLADEEEIKTRKFSSFVVDNWRKAEEDARAEAIKNGVTEEYEIDLKKADGSPIRVVVKKWLQIDRHGEPQGIWMVVRDKTGERSDEAVYQHASSLLEKQLRYQSLSANTPVGILTVDKTARIDSTNAAIEELLGYSANALIGKKFSEIVTSPTGSPISIAAEQAQSAVAQRSDGRLLPVQVSFSKLQTKNQTLHTCFLRDIASDLQLREALEGAREKLETHVRERTEEIARLSDALRTEISERTWAQEQFQVAVESAPNGILIIDQSGTITLVNAYLEQLFGYAREELIGQSIDVLVPERLRDKFPNERENFFANPRVRWLGRRQDWDGLRKDGSEFPIEVGLNPIHTPRGNAVLVSVVDITERKRVEAELRRTAFHDSLTGLPNRTLFLDNLLRLNAAAKRYGHHPFGLLFLDLDRFKVI